MNEECPSACARLPLLLRGRPARRQPAAARARSGRRRLLGAEEVLSALINDITEGRAPRARQGGAVAADASGGAEAPPPPAEAGVRLAGLQHAPPASRSRPTASPGRARSCATTTHSAPASPLGGLQSGSLEPMSVLIVSPLAATRPRCGARVDWTHVFITEHLPPPHSPSPAAPSHSPAGPLGEGDWTGGALPPSSPVPSRPQLRCRTTFWRGLALGARRVPPQEAS